MYIEDSCLPVESLLELKTKIVIERKCGCASCCTECRGTGIVKEKIKLKTVIDYLEEKISSLKIG